MSSREIQEILADIKAKCANIEKMFGIIHENEEKSVNEIK